jgi:hypothetical protein
VFELGGHARKGELRSLAVCADNVSAIHMLGAATGWIVVIDGRSQA